MYDLYSDPGHSWLKVPRKEIRELDIEHQISDFSYQRGKFVYLEKDCDAPLFLSVLGIKIRDLQCKCHHTDRQSRIRSYESFLAV